ncbi:MAG TPA: hydrolase [Candidatus Avamphibacillus sp.]|nr:hydrolase [Candidatus Avamphibacillus sp.]
MEKKTYYVNLGSLEISQIQYANNSVFTIQATEDEVQMLRAKLDDMDRADFEAYGRAHIPILAYHNDESNDKYDAGITEAFQMIYDLGDQNTKKHIDEIGILGDSPL